MPRPARATVVESVPGGSLEGLLLKYNELVKGAGISSSVDGDLSDGDYATLKGIVQDLYTEAGRGGGSAHKKVALLISGRLDEGATSEAFNKAYTEAAYEHRQISDAMSVLMAKARDRMIEEVIGDVLKAPRDEVWEVGRSDSGNPKSGMRSDLDQTFYVFKKDPDTGSLIRDESLDSKFIEAFQGAWERKFGALKLDMLDVVSIEGKNRFPDPRAFSVHEFGKAYEGTIANLRNIEGAYSTHGAVLQQVQRRQLDALMDVTNKRVWQQYGRVGDGEDVGKIAQPDIDLARQSIFYATPELLPDSAFGAAVANYFELQHYMNAAKFNTKYHLRTFDDSLFSRFLMDNFQRMENKVDYLDMNSNQRNTYGAAMLERLLPGSSPEVVSKRQAHLLALEISRDMRMEHVAETPEDLRKVEAYQRHGSVPETDFQKKAVMFDGLAKHMFGEKYRPNETGPQAERRLQTQIEAAEAYHRKLASEFCLESIHSTGVDNFKLLLKPELADRCRYLLGVDSGNWEPVKSNIVTGTKKTMLWGIYDLGMADGARMMRRFDIEVPGKRWQLFKLYAEAQFMPIRSAINDPDTFAQRYAPRVEALADRVKLYFWDQVGFERVGEAEAMDAALAEQRMVWNWRKVAKSMFWDLGALGSLGQISETYFVSKGDFDTVVKKIAEEIFLAVPIVGQAENVRRGGVTTLAMIGGAIYYPVVGKVMVAYTLGKSFYVIYEVEAGIPTRGNIEDALYRGFAGPETVAYGEIGKPPPIFQDSDYARLAAIEKELSDARAAIPMRPVYVRGDTDYSERMKGYYKRHAAAVKHCEELETHHKDELESLRGRKILFEQYRDGTWSGGYFTEGGAVKTQRWISHSLLEDVKPIYAFLPGGVVDFHPKYYDLTDPNNESKARFYDPDEAKARLKDLEETIKTSKSIEEQILASAERAELNLLTERYERAQRYLEKAGFKKGSGDPNTAKVNKELAYRIRRDSLFRWCQKNNVQVKGHVDKFSEAYGKTLFDELEEIGLVTRSEATNIGADDGFLDDDAVEVINRMRNRVQPWTVDKLKERMLEDWERSRTLTATYVRNEQGRRAMNKAHIEKAKDMFMNEAFGLGVEELKDDKPFMDFVAALRLSAIPRAKPRVSATLFKVARDSADLRSASDGEPITERFEISAGVDVCADDTLYLRPYKVKTSVLKASEVGGVTLTEEAQAEVEAILSEHGEALGKGEGLIGIVSVYAAGLADVEGALPATLAGLPGFEGGTAQTGEVLIGQQVGYVPVNPVTVKIDPVRVQVVDQAGVPISGKEDLVTITGKNVIVSGDEYWTTHEFTKHGEKLEIAARYRLGDGRELTASAEYGVNDVENWLDPQPPKDPITLQLPIFMPGNFRAKGVVKAEKPDPNSPYPGYATVRNESLDVSAGTYIPGGATRTSIIGEAVTAVFGEDEDTPRDGSFNVALDGPLAAGESVTLSFEGSTNRHFFSAVKSASLPAAPGTIDFGTVTLRVDRTPVRVPDWSQANPPDFRDYAGALSKVHLRGRPKLGKPSPEERLQYKIQKTEPGAGALVPKGSEVAVILHDKYARKVPKVVGLKIDKAREFLEDQGFEVRDRPGESAPSRAKEDTVATQSVAPGTEHRPSVPIVLTVHTRYVPSCEVPKLLTMTEEKAKEAVEKAKVSLEVVDRAKEAAKSENIDRIYKQEPEPGTRVEEGQPVKVWIYAGVGEPDPGPSGPFYVAFQIFMPDLENSTNVPEFRDKGENESDEDYERAALQYLDSLDANQVLFKPVDVNETVLAFHVSNAALEKYPRKDFAEGTKCACGIYIKGKNKKTEEIHEISGALLLKSLGTYDGLNEVVTRYPALQENESMQGMALTTAEGVVERTEGGNRFRLGPITQGWTLEARKESIRFLIQIGLLVTCYTATVAYDDPLAEEVEVLQDFRDSVMARTAPGRRLIELYYQNGPSLAMLAMEHPELKAGIRIGLDQLVWLLRKTDTEDPVVLARLDVILGRLESVLSVLLPERESAVDEFQRMYIRQQKMPLGVGAESEEW